MQHLNAPATIGSLPSRHLECRQKATFRLTERCRQLTVKTRSLNATMVVSRITEASANTRYFFSDFGGRMGNVLRPETVVPRWVKVTRSGRGFPAAGLVNYRLED